MAFTPYPAIKKSYHDRRDNKWKEGKFETKNPAAHPFATGQ
jgi:hypothetical protein